MARFKVVQVLRDKNPLFDWVPEKLEEAGIDFTVNICSHGEDLARYAADADLVWAYGGSHTSELLKGENLAVLEKCGAILRTGSGTDNVDVSKATELGIIVANTPQAVAESVADHTIALLLSLIRQVSSQERSVRNGEWGARPYKPAHSPSGATWGLVGFGHVSRRIVQKMSGFGVDFWAFDPYVEAHLVQNFHVKPADLHEMIQASDFVSLHCPLNKDTYHLIGEKELRLMKPEALLVNTCRGPVVNESVLIRALQEKWIAGAALDVLDQEPPLAGNPLLEMENVIITPHLAGYSHVYPAEVLQASVEAILDLSEHRWPYSCVNHGVVPRWKDMLPRRER